MRVVHIVEGLDDSYGGPAKSVPYLAHYCRVHGADPLLLSTRYAGEDSNEIIAEKDLPWETFDIFGPAKLRFSWGLQERLSQIGAQHDKSTILHVHNSWNYISYVSYRASTAYDMPLVVSSRGSLFPWSLSQGRIRKKIAWNLFQKRVLNAATVHTTSPAEAKTVAKLGVGRRIFCSKNGVELPTEAGGSKSPFAAKTHLGLNPERRYALFMSRLHKKKGLEMLFNAWAACSDRTGWELLVAGNTEDTKYMGALTEQVDRLKIADTVHFLGFADANRKERLFEAAEFFVLPSFTENFGIVIAEALAARLPVITTVGTPWESLESMHAGWYIKINQNELSSALSEAMRMPSGTLVKMGNNGRQLASSYDWNTIAQEMVELYSQVLVEQRSTS